MVSNVPDGAVLPLGHLHPLDEKIPLLVHAIIAALEHLERALFIGINGGELLIKRGGDPCSLCQAPPIGYLIFPGLPAHGARGVGGDPSIETVSGA